MLKFVPMTLHEDGSVETYKVFRNGKLTRLQPCASGEYCGVKRGGLFTQDDHWCLVLTKEAISYVNFDSKSKLTAKEENQIFNFYRYGETNPSKVNKLVTKIKETENILVNLKEQLKKELK